MRIDEVVDGLLDPNAEEIIGEEIPDEQVEEELDAEERGRGRQRGARAPACCSSRRRRWSASAIIGQLYAKHDEGARQARLAQQALPQGAGGHLARADDDPLLGQADRGAVRERAQAGRRGALVRARHHGAVRGEGRHAARLLHQGVPRQRGGPGLGAPRDHRRASPTARRCPASRRRSWSSSSG